MKGGPRSSLVAGAKAVYGEALFGSLNAQGLDVWLSRRVRSSA
jgi:hypothetical protein